MIDKNNSFYISLSVEQKNSYNRFNIRLNHHSFCYIRIVFQYIFFCFSWTQLHVQEIFSFIRIALVVLHINDVNLQDLLHHRPLIQ